MNEIQLKEIYESMISAGAPVQIAKMNHNGRYFKWILLFSIGSALIEIGIAENGSWCICTNGHGNYVEDEKSYLYFMKLLEFPMQDIESKLVNSLQDYLDENIIKECFPFAEIVMFVFKYNKRDYWVKLALRWHELFHPKYKELLKEHMEKLLLLNQISQKSRHQIRRELNRLK